MVHSIFCDHLTALGDNQLPADSHSAWKLHASASASIPVRQLIVTCRSSGHKNFAGPRSLENLYGLRPLLGRGRVPEVCSGPVRKQSNQKKKSENLVFRESLGDASFRSRAATSASASASASVAASVFVWPIGNSERWTEISGRTKKMWKADSLVTGNKTKKVIAALSRKTEVQISNSF